MIIKKSQKKFGNVSVDHQTSQEEAYRYVKENFPKTLEFGREKGSLPNPPIEQTISEKISAKVNDPNSLQDIIDRNRHERETGQSLMPIIERNRELREAIRKLTDEIRSLKDQDPLKQSKFEEIKNLERVLDPHNHKAEVSDTDPTIINVDFAKGEKIGSDSKSTKPDDSNRQQGAA